jgi:Tat protein secretion system quality control protein TatD with DNase activity
VRAGQEHHRRGDLQMKILGWHLEIAAKYRRPVTIHCVSGCWDHLLRLFKDKEIATAVTSGRIPSIILHSCHSLPVEMLPAFFSAVGDTFALNNLALSTNSTKKKKPGNEKRKPYPLPEFQIVEPSSSSRSSSSEVQLGDTIVEEGKDEDSHCRLYFSMSGRIFGSPKGIRLARTVPFKRLLLESDSPDQLPVPYIRKKSTSDSKSGGSGGDSRKHGSERNTLSYNQPGTLTYTCVEMAKQLDVSCELMAKQTNENARKAYRTCIP